MRSLLRRGFAVGYIDWDKLASNYLVVCASISILLSIAVFVYTLCRINSLEHSIEKVLDSVRNESSREFLCDSSFMQQLDAIQSISSEIRDNVGVLVERPSFVIPAKTPMAIRKVDGNGGK